MKAGTAFCMLLIWLSGCGVLQAQTSAPDQIHRVQAARVLFENGRWHELLHRLPAWTEDPADLNYYRGMALARLERWPEARFELSVGQRKSPRDKRFPMELAGVAFRQGMRREALAFISAALRLDPADRYCNDFAGTLFVLQGKTRAALKYWNRIGKPAIESIRSTPEPLIDPVLLDGAFMVRPASIANLHDYDATLLRLNFLEVFQSVDLELTPIQDERFDLVLRNTARGGLGGQVLPTLAALLSGAPFATVYPEVVNIRHRAVHVTSLARWDSRKRRLALSFSGPVGSDPGRRLRFHFDARDEEWNISGAVGMAYSGTRRFPLKRIGAGLSFGMAAGVWVLETGAIVTRRDFRLPAGDPGGAFMRDGLSLKYTFGVRRNLFSAPDLGLEVEGRASLQSGVLFGAEKSRFAGFATEIYPQWRPAAHDADYAISGRIRAGTLSKAAPFDEFFSFGLERDNDLFLRGHGGTDDGRKGRGPLGTRYILAGGQFEKTLSSTGLWRLTAGPFIDAGRMYDVHGVFGSRRWLCDLGLHVRFSVLNRVAVTVSFGQDLRSGGHVFFVNTSQSRE